MCYVIISNMEQVLKQKIANVIEKEYDAHDVVSITVSVNKFANKVDIITEKRERILGGDSTSVKHDPRRPYNHG